MADEQKQSSSSDSDDQQPGPSRPRARTSEETSPPDLLPQRTESPKPSTSGLQIHRRSSSSSGSQNEGRPQSSPRIGDKRKQSSSRSSRSRKDKKTRLDSSSSNPKSSSTSSEGLPHDPGLVAPRRASLPGEPGIPSESLFKVKTGTLNQLKDVVMKNTQVIECDKANVNEILKESFGVEKLQSVGKGSFGEVFVCNSSKTHQWLALKVYYAFFNREKVTYGLEDIGKQKAREALVKSLHEIIVMKALKGHKNFAVYLDHFMINNEIYIVMEMETGTLKQQIERRFPNGMNEDHTKYWFLQMAEGIAYMHGIGIVHGDAHCGNVLIRQLNDGSTVCKWTDFGGSELLPWAHQNIDGWIDSERKSRKQFRPGSKRLRKVLEQETNKIDLKIVSDEESDRVTDLAILGDILNALFTGNLDDIDGLDEIGSMPQEQFVQKDTPTLYRPMTQPAKDLLWKLLQNGRQRQLDTADEVIQHPWFNHPGVDPGFERV